MLTGEIRNQIDRVWDAFWTGGISNPLEVIEQLTYLLFIKRLDDTHKLELNKLQTIGEGKLVFTEEQEQYRWSVFQNAESGDLYNIIANKVFPFIREMGQADTTFARHMKDARFTLPPEKAALLTKVVDLLSAINMDNRDTKGDLYEYLLSKLSTSGQNGQFRTPRHIIKMMIELMQPNPDDIICDPACGTAGFLVAALEYLIEHYRNDIYNKKRQHFETKMFNAFDFDSTMLRIASMNMMLHGIANANIENKDSLSDTNADAKEEYSLILANPPFKGSLQFETAAKDLVSALGMKAPKAKKDGKPSGVQAKTELMFLVLFLRLLKPGGRCAVIVPDGVLFGSSNAHQTTRKTIVENHRLEAIISMPSGVFKPYAGVSTAIMIFTKTGIGGTDNVWFYDMRSDGYSLDDKRNPTSDNDIPDIIERYRNLEGETNRTRTDQSFFVSKDEIAAQNYDLSINRYKQTVHEVVQHEAPQKILDELEGLELEIQQGLRELRGMLA
jgi:type I restriction enzyme M protein